MKNNRYLIRLDDACPTMDRAKWQRVLIMLDKYGVKPMIGVIPHNEDTLQKINSEDLDFWRKVKLWEQKGYAIALHGFNHCYCSDKGLEGINPLWKRSEFSGVPLDVQKQKIKDGYNLMLSYGIRPKYFFAPSHTFDKNTLSALRECTDIRIISDTIATKPYVKEDFIFIPQLGGHCVDLKIPGVWTFCLHPNTMSEENFEVTETFLRKHHYEIISFQDIELAGLKRKNILSKVLSYPYFLQRKIRKIR